MYLIAIDNGNALQRANFHGYIRRFFTPFFLLVLAWNPPNCLRADAVWAFDICFRKYNCRAINLPHYLELARRSTHVIVQDVMKARNDYVGERFQVVTNNFYYAQWLQQRF